MGATDCEMTAEERANVTGEVFRRWLKTLDMPDGPEREAILDEITDYWVRADPPMEGE